MIPRSTTKSCFPICFATAWSMAKIMMTMRTMPMAIPNALSASSHAFSSPPLTALPSIKQPIFG